MTSKDRKEKKLQKYWLVGWLLFCLLRLAVSLVLFSWLRSLVSIVYLFSCGLRAVFFWFFFLPSTWLELLALSLLYDDACSGYLLITSVRCFPYAT